MSNVYSNASFAVLSVMDTFNPTLPDGTKGEWVGSTCFVQRKPEADYPNVLVVSFPADNWPRDDFTVQDRFNANVTANIMSGINGYSNQGDPIIMVNSNSSISPKSYKMTAVEIT